MQQEETKSNLHKIEDKLIEKFAEGLDKETLQ
jgi:hypothetical protein